MTMVELNSSLHTYQTLHFVSALNPLVFKVCSFSLLLPVSLGLEGCVHLCTGQLFICCASLCVYTRVHVCACIWDVRVGLCGPCLLFVFIFPSYFPLMQPCPLALVPVRCLSPPSPTLLGAGVLCPMVGITFTHQTLKGLSWAPWSFSSSL